MRRRIWNSMRQNPGRVALGLALLIALINVVFVASVFLNQSAANRLRSQVADLTENLAQLRQVEEDGLRGLEGEALTAEGELAILRASFPNIGEPFDIYRQGFALAEANQIEIRVLETGISSLEETPIGLFEVTSFRVRGVGERSNCIRLLGALEQAGLEALALNEITLGGEDQICDFEVVLASLGALSPGEAVDG